ncbi:MAG: class I SAM-dependent methyltransferase [Phycisphaeraceae bacterium JB051]
MSNDKSTVDEIRARFDQDVERFSNLETGQTTVPDSRLMWELVADTASAVHPNATSMLDIGCGAGNGCLYVLQQVPDMDVTLVDLSLPMLDRARHRVGEQTQGSIRTMQGDIRDLDLGVGQHDIIISGLALHHLRTAEQWQHVMGKVSQSLRPGGSFFLVDMFKFDEPAVQELNWQRYGQYLMIHNDQAFRDKVYDYVQKEDTPFSVPFVSGVMRDVGFESVEILHKKWFFAAFWARKS